MTELRCDIYIQWTPSNEHPIELFLQEGLPEGSEGIGNTGNLDIAVEEVKIA